MSDIHITQMQGTIEVGSTPKKVIIGDREAPDGLRVGRRVRIVGGCDECFDQSYVGAKGTIVDLDESECGASKGDPMWMVWVKGRGKEGFWGEELQPL